MRNRGVTFWEDGDDKRVFYAAREYLYGLNAETGRLDRKLREPWSR